MTALITSSRSDHDHLDALATTVLHAHSLEELVRPMLELLQAVTGLQSTYLTTIDEVAGVQHVLFARNTKAMCVPEGLSVPWEGTLCKRAIDDELFYNTDVARHWGDCEAARELGIATYAGTPLRSRQGELLGTLCAISDTQTPMADGTASALGLFAKLISQHMEREKLFAELQRSNHLLAANALIDPVTSLPNRRALMEDIRLRLSTRRPDRTFVVAFIDLDDFKTINDQYGHEAGDQFLEAIARRLQGVLRPGDLAARLGGDEFVVLMDTPADQIEAASVSLEHRLAFATRGRFSLSAVDLEYAGPSIGVAVATPGCGDAQELLSAADHAMYTRKRTRKARAASSTMDKHRA